MPAATPRPVREELVRRCQQGEQLMSIAKELGLSYRGVRGLWRRYRQQGGQGLDNDYAHCGSSGPRFVEAIHQAALALKREHPRWGVGLIRLQLHDDYPEQSLPSERTLNRWIQAAGLQPLRGRRPKTRAARGLKPHEVWQIDAKERLRLADGQGCCQLSVVDEASGATLGAVPFPPLALAPGATDGRAGGSAGVVRALGTARAGKSG